MSGPIPRPARLPDLRRAACGLLAPLLVAAGPTTKPIAGPIAKPVTGPIAASPAAATTTSATAQDDDLFSMRLAGGTRGAGDHPAVFLLLPKRPVAVADAQPTLLWYLDRDTPARQEVVFSRMVDEGGGGAAADRRYTAQSAIHVVVPGPSRAGLQRIDLKARGAGRLGDGIYKVTVMVTLNRIDVASNPFSTGFLHKFPAQPAGDAWLATMRDLCDGIDRDPTDAGLHRRRRRMLADADVFSTFTPPDANLPGVSAADRVALDNATARAAGDRDALLSRLDPVGGINEGVKR